MKTRTIFISYICSLLAFCLLAYCTKDSDGFIDYEIKAGKHYANKRTPCRYDKHHITFEFKTNDSWLWGKTYSGHSKIGGIGQMSLFETGWHINSCRLTYHVNNGYHILGMEVYADGSMKTLNIDTIAIGGRYTCKIDRIGNEWCCTVNGKTGVLPAGKKYAFGVRLYPYVGGSYTLSSVWVVPIRW